MARKARVTLEGTEALTVAEARALVRAALVGMKAVAAGDTGHVVAACEKVAEGLIAAGQGRESVENLLRAE